MRPLNPVKKFAVLSSIFVTGLCLGLAFTIAYLLEHHMGEREWLDTAAFVRHQVDEHNLGPFFTEPRLRREPAEYKEVFKRLSSLPEVVRIKVWDREATVLWTDDERLIGRRFPENPELKQALAGRLSVELKTLRKAENVLERERFTQLAEIYVPIPSKPSGEIIGVVEVYMLPARLFAGIQRMRVLVWGIVITGGILLYGGLIPIVRRSYRKQLDLERSLREYSQHLEKISRHKSEFLANMSHELRTPMNAVLGFSELLAQQTYGPLTEKQSRYVDNIHKSGRHLLALISDLLDLSKVEAGKVELRPEPFELREALAVALAAIRPLAKAKGMQLSLQVDEGLSTLTADPLRFKQILYNL
ncbi:MAG: hypothetical protein HY278_02760, partial [candidate division NC10 bacterium]|nr:hypothetical protein [candidate division NC10 bacterium]